MMDAHPDVAASSIAAAIGEPARARMLYSLVDGRARTATELAAVAEVTAATASVHLQRLRAQRLVRVAVQGRHRYYSLDGTQVADALEALSVLAGDSRERFVPNAPRRLRAARTCYDHLAGTLGVAIHDRFLAARWLSASDGQHAAYDLTPSGTRVLEALGVDVEAMRLQRRRFAFECLDWSERRPHIGGALGAALLSLALRKKWVTRDLDSRALGLTTTGRRELHARLGLDAGL
jgi:DNA-binding transcriptional ArsR family regulator